MAIRYVVQTGDPVLRQKCTEVKNFNKELCDLLDDMKVTVRAEQGAGLAAPQVGVPLRVVVIDVGEGYFELVNPVIISTKGEQTGAEGCLSVRASRVPSPAPTKLKPNTATATARSISLPPTDFSPAPSVTNLTTLTEFYIRTRRRRCTTFRRRTYENSLCGFARIFRTCA